MEKDNTHPHDFERISMFYIFAGNEEIVGKVETFYDFDEQMIEIEGLDEAKLSSGAVSLVKLAFNLYNNYRSGTVTDFFGNLDESNCILAINAIKLRFNVK